jgi:mono/diheme cytochrome c family protein
MNEPSAWLPLARLDDANCIACHSQDARGIPGVYPSLVGSPVVLGDLTAPAVGPAAVARALGLEP